MLTKSIQSDKPSSVESIKYQLVTDRQTGGRTYRLICCDYYSTRARRRLQTLGNMQRFVKTVLSNIVVFMH